MSGSHHDAPRETVAELARRLALNAEAVCREYLGNGQRSGRYWHAGDVANTPGRSLYVRLAGERAGKWTDAATGEHGDLLDLIALARNLPSLKQTITEARRFLDLPPEAPRRTPTPPRRDATRAAQRLFAMGRPIAGTLAETYLQHRGIVLDGKLTALRFHAHCYYRAAATAPQDARPALLAAITDLDGRITGVHRTWLDASGHDKAHVANPRRALGNQLGHGARFDRADTVMLAGEGLETVLSLKTIMPALPMVAALSASHLGELILPQGLQRVYVARDRDAAGRWAFERLAKRAHDARICAFPLDPVASDFNDDLLALGATALRSAVRQQLASEDTEFVSGTLAQPLDRRRSPLQDGT
jgi:hypothetical protein